MLLRNKTEMEEAKTENPAREKELEQKIKSLEHSLNNAEHFYQKSRKLNYRLGWITAGAVALSFLTYSCPRKVVQEAYVPYPMYQQTAIVHIKEPGMYNIQSNGDGIHVLPSRIKPPESQPSN